ncbi:macrolide 2'-phosphotransferase [Clavibacter tessellarius]|uniref:macrolide 2'-phosphotransferase n=1 Tax=Clavibacter tessellarius TaxID=31965 RepID=UPI003243E020
MATSAVAGLDVVRSTPFTAGGAGDFDSALLTTGDGRELLVRVPTTQASESEQSADLVALRALSTGIRSRLPFRVPEFLGQAPIRPTRGFVYEHVPGRVISLDEIPAGAGLARSIGAAVSAVHSLPTGFVADAGLPVLSAAEIHSQTAALIDRAAATALVPSLLLSRWEEALDDASLWQFQPAVVNGAVQASSFLVDGDDVTGMIGWSGSASPTPRTTCTGCWARAPSTSPRACSARTTRRTTSRSTASSSSARSSTPSLEIARWLLHGTDMRNQGIIDDAVNMLSALVDTVRADEGQRIAHETLPVMDVDQVEEMLDSRPQPTVGPDGPRDPSGVRAPDQSATRSSSE